MGTLYTSQFPYPPGTSVFNTENTVTQREFLVKGFRIQREFNYGTSPQGPMELHYAIMQYKGNPETLAAAGTNVPATLPKNFFRINTNSQTESIDFPSYAATGTPYDIRLSCCAINPDNSWRIITHVKKKIGQMDGGDSNRADVNIWKIKKYWKFGKQCQYTATGGTILNPIYEVWWYLTGAEVYHPSNPVGINYLRTVSQNTVIFKNNA
jgi:hypothetical protein